MLPLLGAFLIGYLALALQATVVHAGDEALFFHRTVYAD